MEFIIGAILDHIFYKLGRRVLRCITMGKFKGNNPHHFYLISALGFIVILALVIFIAFGVS